MPTAEELLSLAKKLAITQRDNLRRELADTEAHAGKLQGHIYELDALLGDKPAKPTGRKTKAKPAAKSKASLAAAGEKIVAAIRSKKGEYMASATLAEIGGTPRVADAIKATGVAVESRGPGRKKEYRIK